MSVSADEDPRGRVRVAADYPAHIWLLPWSLRELSSALQAMLRALAVVTTNVPLNVDLHLVDDASITAVNRNALACFGPTNVLSFSGEGDMPGVLLLSLDTLERECLLYGQAPAAHSLWLLAHGVGHLAGLDHGLTMDAVCEACFTAAKRVLRV